VIITIEATETLFLRILRVSWTEKENNEVTTTSMNVDTRFG